MTKNQRSTAVVLVVALVITGLAIWFASDRRTRLMLATDQVTYGTVAVRVNRFEQAWELPGPVSMMPPNWMVRYPWLLKGWVWLFQQPQQVQEGLVWVLVEATVATDQPLDLSEIEYRLDYGTYEIWAHGGSFRTETGRPYAVSTRFELTDGPVPTALEIRVKDQWLRFPIHAR